MNMKKLFRSQFFSPHSRPLSEGERETPLPVGEQGCYVLTDMFPELVEGNMDDTCL